MVATSIQDQIQRYIAEQTGVADMPTIRRSEDLFADGLLDSLSLLRLITYIEESYDLVIDGAMVVPENFETLAAICDFISRQRDAEH